MNSCLAQYNEAPEGWEIRKLKFVSNIRTSNVDKHIVEGEMPVRLCNYVDVYYNDVIDPDLPFMVGSVTEEEYKKFRLRKGQVIVTKDSESWDDIAIPAFVPNDVPGVVCGYHLAIINAHVEELVGAYLSWLARSEVLNDQFKLFARGVTRFGLSHHALKNALVILPDTQEQQDIANFLDQKTAHIDALIKKKRKLLELLDEKRAVIITNALTKGVNPNAPMKDSGIDWLGKIPKHWSTCRTRFLARVNQPKRKPGLNSDDVVSFVPMTNVGRYGGITLDQEKPIDEIGDGYTLFSEGDVVIAKITPCFENGKGALAIGLQNETAYGTTELHVVSAKFDLQREFFFYLSISHIFRGLGEGVMYGAGGQKRVPERFVKDFEIPLTTMDEQKEIVSHIKGHLSKIDNTSAKVKEVIDRLKEYRSALITEAVTGKIKVT